MRFRPIVPILFAALAAAALSSASAFLAPAARAAEDPAAPPFTQSRFPTLTPGQVLLLQEAIRKGELTDDVRQIVRLNPQVRPYLPAAWREMRQTWKRQQQDPGYQFDTPLPKQKKEKRERKFIPTTVKPGDRVLYERYAGQKITVDNVERVLVRERDILGQLDR